MSVEHKQELIREFTPKFIHLCDHVKQYHLGLIAKGQGVYPNNPHAWAIWDRHMDFYSAAPWADNPFSVSPHFDTAPDGSECIKAHFNEWCWIAFSGFRPKAGGKYTIQKSEPEFVHKKTVGIGRVGWENNTDRPQPETHTFTEKTELVTIDAKHVAAEIATRMTQEFSYGSEAIGAEAKTEIELSIKAEVSQDTTTQQTMGDEESYTWNGEVAPHSRLSIIRTREVARQKRDITIMGELDFDVWIFSDGDFMVLWTGVEEMRLILSGVGRERRSDGTENWAELYARNSIASTHRNADGPVGQAYQDWFINMIASPIVTTTTETKEFDNAKEALNEISEEPL